MSVGIKLEFLFNKIGECGGGGGGVKRLVGMVWVSVINNAIEYK